MRDPVTLAVDIGGTKFAVGLVTPAGELAASARVATPPGGDAQTLWQALSDLLEQITAGVELSGVGIGAGGPMTWPAGEVSPINMPGWRAFPLRERLAARFPGIPVRIHNDAVTFAVAEHWKGAGAGVANMLGMVVSTGVGGGLILGDRLIDGGTGNAGHVGHIVVDPAGPECGCGGRGCLEAIARGPGLAAWAVSEGWKPGAASESAVSPAEASGRTSPSGTAGNAVGPPPRPGRVAVDGVSSGGKAVGPPPRPHQPQGPTPASGWPTARAAPNPAGDAGAWTGAPLYVEAAAASGRQLALDAAAGDETALRAMTRAGRAIGTAIASATHLCDLDVVAIGGGLSQAGPLIFDPLHEALREHARLEFTQRVRVVPAALGQDAGLIGAAALLLAAERYWSPSR